MNPDEKGSSQGHICDLTDPQRVMTLHSRPRRVRKVAFNPGRADREYPGHALALARRSNATLSRHV